MKKNKVILNKITIGINLIFILFATLHILNVFNLADSLVGGYLFAIPFLTLLYATTFVHLFWYNAFKEKILIGFADLFPLVILTLLTSMVWFTNLKTEILSSIYPLLGLYFLPLFLITLTNYLLHKLLIKLNILNKKNSSKKFSKKNKKR